MAGRQESTQTLDHVEMEEEPENDDGDPVLRTYEPTLSESTLSGDLVEDSDEDVAMQSNSFAHPSSVDTSETDKEADTLSTWRSTGFARGDGIAMRSSPDDGLLSQTREQLSSMAGGFSLFGEKDWRILGDDINREAEGSAHIDMAPTDLSDQNMFFDQNQNGFSTVDSSTTPLFGVNQDTFGEGFTAPGGESDFHIDEIGMMSGDLNQGTTGDLTEFRDQGPKKLVGQSDLFSEESNRFKFLGE